MKAVAYLGSRAIYVDMVSAVKSLLVHNDIDKVFLLIEDDVFQYEMDNRVEAINVSEIIPKYFRKEGPNYDTEWTYIGLISSAFTKVFPDLDKLLAIDCDTIVTQDISELWDISLDDYYFAGVQETLLSAVKHHGYINSGVLLVNLKKLREDGKDDEIIYAMNKYRYTYVSQDAINDVCKGKILFLPSIYNACQYT